MKTMPAAQFPKRWLCRKSTKKLPFQTIDAVSQQYSLLYCNTTYIAADFIEMERVFCAVYKNYFFCCFLHMQYHIDDAVYAAIYSA